MTTAVIVSRLISGATLGLAAAVRLGCGFFYLSSDPGSVLPLGRLLSGGTLLAAIALFVVRSRTRQSLFS